MRRHLSRTPFIGRHQELAVLCERLDAAGHDQGQGGMVLVAGEPGIGKTRLAAEFAVRARDAGWLVLTGRAYESEGMPPYLPFVEALRQLLLSGPRHDLGAVLGREAPDIARLVPEIRDALPELPQPTLLNREGERYRLCEAVTDVLLTVARSQDGGLLLILDDLHWADTPTLLVLLHLARKLAAAPLLVVGTYRTVDLTHTHPLAAVIAELQREGLVERLRGYVLAELPRLIRQPEQDGTGIRLDRCQLDAAVFPRLVELAPYYTARNRDAEFAYGLDVILAAFQAQLAN
jgi:predicted ATPase